MADEAALADVVRYIVQRVDPERIILFGSRARGAAAPDSDWDLLIVDDAPVPRPGLLSDLCRDLVRIAAPPVDLLLYRREQFEQRRHERNSVIGRAAREGRVVYERP
jgi:predicted nucleotidyltransferase